MKIIEFGLPATFPDFMVPDEAAAFCEEADGMELGAAYDLAKIKGYLPTIQHLRHMGSDVWGFALTVNGLGIPFMVKVDADVINQQEARHAS